MDHITTYMGEDFTPFTPDVNQIHIEDIAHALSLICRANGHIVSFYSVAQHSINCANEAKERGLSKKVQIACLLHDASEAYLSDITRPVKKYLLKYIEVEKHLQEIIYNKFLDSPLSEDETAYVKLIDHDMLACEFNTLMRKKVFSNNPNISSKPTFKFEGFSEVEKKFLDFFYGLKTYPSSMQKSLKAQITEIENGLQKKDKSAVLECVKQHRISKIFEEKQYIKRISAQVDVFIHAYGILIALTKILDDGEVIESLSLGAGSADKAFDVSTSKRIAEFKFATWDSGGNAGRQNGIFKDFLELAINTANVGKAKYIYCLSAAEVIEFLSDSDRSLASVLSGNPMNKKYPEYQEQYKTVKAFYHAFKDEVKIVDLRDYIGTE